MWSFDTCAAYLALTLFLVTVGYIAGLIVYIWGKSNPVRAEKFAERERGEE